MGICLQSHAKPCFGRGRVGGIRPALNKAFEVTHPANSGKLPMAEYLVMRAAIATGSPCGMAWVPRPASARSFGKGCSSPPGSEGVSSSPP